MTITGVEVVLRSYVRDAATCSHFTNGTGVYDSKDYQNTGGMLNAQSVEEFRKTESGSGC